MSRTNSITKVEPIFDSQEDIELIAECMTFKDAQGHAQLMCILNGQSTSFKVSCQDDGVCSIAKRKIRFVGTAFFAEVNEIAKNPQSSKIHKLCSLMQREIAEGQVVFEQKTAKGDRHLIAAPSVAALLEKGAIKNKKGKTLQYKSLHFASNDFFTNVAKAFGASIQDSLKLHEQFMKKNQPHEATSTEGQRLSFERKAFAKSQPTRSVWEYFYSLKDAFLKLFDSNSTVLKIQEQFILSERALLAEKRTIDDERKAREKDEQRFEARREERKRDDLRFTAKQEEIKVAAHKQNDRLFRKDA